MADKSVITKNNFG